MSRRWAVAFLLTGLAAGGCSSATLADLEPDRSDADGRRQALVSLSEDAETDEGLRVELAERARRRLDEDDTLPVRLVAMRVLARLARSGVQTKETVQALSNHARNDRDFWGRVEAIESLADLSRQATDAPAKKLAREGTEDALRTSVRMDLEADRDVRIHAARELALLRSERTLPELVQALSDETPDVRYHTQRALVAITGGDHGPTKDDWERWLRSNPPAERPR